VLLTPYSNQWIDTIRDKIMMNSLVPSILMPLEKEEESNHKEEAPKEGKQEAPASPPTASPLASIPGIQSMPVTSKVVITSNMTNSVPNIPPLHFPSHHQSTPAMLAPTENPISPRVRTCSL